jgi:hypothetical protein
MQLGLIEDHPTARPAAMKRLAELRSEHGGRMSVRQRGARRRVQLAIEDFGNVVLWYVIQIGVRCVFFQRFRGRRGSV